MSILKKLGEALFGPDTTDTEYYSHVAHEIREGQVDQGLWARSLAETAYDDQKARARYIALRVAHVKALVTAEAQAQKALVARRSALDEAYRKRDYATCLRGWSVLAEQGDPGAMYSLAYLHAHGQGVDKNPYVAYYWAKRSELAGNPNAHALMYALIPQMVSWDIKRAEEEAVRSHSMLPRLSGPN